MDSELLGLMDRARGEKNRSQFIRDAIAKMLGLPLEMGRSPDRVKIRHDEIHRHNLSLNDTPSSEAPMPAINKGPYQLPPKKRTKKKP